MFASGPWTVNLEWLSRLTIALCPPRCTLCGADGQLCAGRPLDLCARCEQQLPWLAQPLHRPGGALDAQFTPWRYEEPIDALVRDLKFHDRPQQARVLGTLLGTAIARAALPRPALLVPMPLHQRRLVARGYNQAQELAVYAAAMLDLPLRSHWLRRVRATAEQSHLGAQGRAANVAGAFACDADLRGLDVALLDDVLTTGSTAQEAARVLRSAGARSVQLWAVARA